MNRPHAHQVAPPRSADYQLTQPAPMRDSSRTTKSSAELNTSLTPFQVESTPDTQEVACAPLFRSSPLVADRGGSPFLGVSVFVRERAASEREHKCYALPLTQRQVACSV